MDDIQTDASKLELRKEVAARLEVVRAQLRATGATVLTPTAEWTLLHKEMLALNRKLR